MARYDDNVIFKFKARTADLDRAFRKIDHRFRSLNRKVSGFSSKMINSFRGLDYFATTVLSNIARLGFGSVAASMEKSANVMEYYQEMESKMRDSAKMYGAEQEVATEKIIAKGRAIANATRFMQVDIAKANAIAARAGKTSTEIFRLMEPAALLALASNYGLAESIDLLICLLYTSPSPRDS